MQKACRVDDQPHVAARQRLRGRRDAGFVRYVERGLACAREGHDLFEAPLLAQCAHQGRPHAAACSRHHCNRHLDLR